jgi:hypothetical protein
MSAPNHVEELAAYVSELVRAYETTRADVEDQMGRFEHTRDLDPIVARDTQGRYLLLDALTAIVNAQTALLVAHDHAGRVDDVGPSTP